MLKRKDDAYKVIAFKSLQLTQPSRNIITYFSYPPF